MHLPVFFVVMRLAVDRPGQPCHTHSTLSFATFFFASLASFACYHTYERFICRGRVWELVKDGGFSDTAAVPSVARACVRSQIFPRQTVRRSRPPNSTLFTGSITPGPHATVPLD